MSVELLIQQEHYLFLVLFADLKLSVLQSDLSTQSLKTASLYDLDTEVLRTLSIYTPREHESAPRQLQPP